MSQEDVLCCPRHCSARCTGTCQVHAVQQPSSPSPGVVFLMIIVVFRYIYTLACQHIAIVCMGMSSRNDAKSPLWLVIDLGWIIETHP